MFFGGPFARGVVPPLVHDHFPPCVVLLVVRLLLLILHVGSRAGICSRHSRCVYSVGRCCRRGSWAFVVVVVAGKAIVLYRSSLAFVVLCDSPRVLLKESLKCPPITRILPWTMIYNGCSLAHCRVVWDMDRGELPGCSAFHLQFRTYARLLFLCKADVACTCPDHDRFRSPPITITPCY